MGKYRIAAFSILSASCIALAAQLNLPVRTIGGEEYYYRQVKKKRNNLWNIQGIRHQKGRHCQIQSLRGRRIAKRPNLVFSRQRVWQCGGQSASGKPQPLCKKRRNALRHCKNVWHLRSRPDSGKPRSEIRAESRNDTCHPVCQSENRRQARNALRGQARRHALSAVGQFRSRFERFACHESAYRPKTSKPA